MRQGLKCLVAAAAAGTLGVTVAPAAAADHRRPVREVEIVRELGEYVVPHKLEVDGTTFGGISGFDRDPVSGRWYFISDDRGRYGSARFYVGRLTFDPRSGVFQGVELTAARTFHRPDGSAYPEFGLPYSVDPESLRFDPWSRRLLWSSEGDRPDKANPTVPVAQMSLRWADTKGTETGRLRLPRTLRMTDGDSGPRRNFGIEGLATTRRHIVAAVEGPRYEDGAPPTVQRGAPARITVWSRATGRPVGQYVYPLDRLPQAPSPADGLSDTGVSELLAVSRTRFLALERTWLEGVGYKARIYEFDLSAASNVLDRIDLKRPHTPVSKRLVYEFKGNVENFEGLAWGPKLATGECSLVAGSDDNFYAPERTVFVALAVKGCPRTLD
ncbi:esterase-like activity of phytase family protein [Actinocorallia sp. A-T 12471]|uniref:esterase-like activity of phytase family protein n=1 Tax=Actinocorallia sp. A-T 12471 TaxID=3089813 RepID=UPI0029D2028D|nr:esterase-like activity of phytase family protein [Actinocorallia sp. A-T 12471]MDX6742757.1 esterase-like activity of phytase family protein [Actinocorallia sp. A-T 12471]